MVEVHTDPMVRRRHRSVTYDIVTPTDRERLEHEISVRRKRYFAIMIPCLALVAFGFFVPAPPPARVVALVCAAVLPPFAAIVGNARIR